jgi:hypothetical protein
MTLFSLPILQEVGGNLAEIDKPTEYSGITLNITPTTSKNHG